MADTDVIFDTVYRGFGYAGVRTEVFTFVPWKNNELFALPLDAEGVRGYIIRDVAFRQLRRSWNCAGDIRLHAVYKHLHCTCKVMDTHGIREAR